MFVRNNSIFMHNPFANLGNPSPNVLRMDEKIRSNMRSNAVKVLRYKIKQQKTYKGTKKGNLFSKTRLRCTCCDS